MRTKTLIAIGACLVSQAAFADNNKDLLRQIDQKCADTWCEGDFSFKFKSVHSSRYMMCLEFEIAAANGNIGHTFHKRDHRKVTSLWGITINSRVGTKDAGPWLVTVCVKSRSPINGKFTDELYDRLTEAIGWAELEIQRR